MNSYSVWSGVQGSSMVLGIKFVWFSIWTSTGMQGHWQFHQIKIQLHQIKVIIKRNKCTTIVSRPRFNLGHPHETFLYLHISYWCGEINDQYSQLLWAFCWDAYRCWIRCETYRWYHSYWSIVKIPPEADKKPADKPNFQLVPSLACPETAWW